MMSILRMTILTISLVASLGVLASDSIPLKMNGREFRAGDTLYAGWSGHMIKKAYPLATLHLWIDNLETGRRWKLRYPIVNGEADIALAFSEKLMPGTYAFNFMGAENFLEIAGKVRKVKVRTALNYKTKKLDTINIEERPGPIRHGIRASMLNRLGLLYDENLVIREDGSFTIPPIIFGDTASLVFDPSNPRESYLIEMKTPLDTTFTPFWSETVFVTVKGEESVARGDTSSYHFDFSGSYPNSITLQEVVVTGPSKAEQFEKEYVSPMFRGLDSRTLSALDNSELIRTNNIWTFIQARTPGVIITQNGPWRAATWRGQPVTFFLDEMLIGINDITIQPTDVALIKVFPPPTGITARAPGGVIAIYTKRGDDYGGPPSPYTYIVKGYTHGESTWQ